jgi:hypothetical protein
MAKRERTKALGAEVVLYDRNKEDRAAIARKIAEERGATLVPPFDDPMIIAGQGTIGREIVEDLAAFGLKPEIVVIGASGGGLAAGTALGVKSRVPSCKFFTAEPEGFDDTRRSFKSGHRETNPKLSGTICDALMTQTPQNVTAFLTGLGIGKYGILALIMVMYLVLGCLMDALAMIILTVPIVFPVIKELGFDPIWFGVIIVMTVELGLIHPPVGMNIFVIKSVIDDVKISTIFYGVFPFILTDILRLILLVAFPIIALWLPSHM